MIRNIWCVGRNYADHAKELGNAVPAATGDPMIFLKAGSCATTGSEIVIPSWTKEIHHELEIAVRWNAHKSLTDFTLALDLTERAKQTELKAKGSPWTLAKSFTGACPIGKRWLSLPRPKDLNKFVFALEVNGELRQKGQAADMIFPLEDLEKFVLSRFPVEPGDVLLTGTPAGVGPLKAGDQARAWMRDSENNLLLDFSWTVQGARE